MPARPRKATAAVTKPDFAKLLANVRLPEREVPVCMRPDLVADHEAADAELLALLQRPAQKFSGDGRGELRQKILDLEAEMAASTYPFRLRGLPRPEFRALVRAHPPRKAEDGTIEANDRLGVNYDSFFPALTRACLVDPVPDDEQWETMQSALTDKQFDMLATAAWNLNTEAVDIPFSRAASLMNGTSDSE